MAKIRQEIPIIESSLGASSAIPGDELVTLNTGSYNGTVTYAFEAVASYSTAGTVTLRRNDGSGTVDATLTWTSSETTASRKRVAFTPPGGATEYYSYRGTAIASANVRISRIIVIQDATITSTETQIEVGSDQDGITGTSGAPTVFTNPKYWLYTSANWNGTIAAYFEGTIRSVSTKITASLQLQVDDGSFGGWANVTNGLVQSSTGVFDLVRAGSAFTLTNGRHYRVVAYTSSSKSAIQASGAKIIMVQTDSPTLLEAQYLLLSEGDIGTGLQNYLTLL